MSGVNKKLEDFFNLPEVKSVIDGDAKPAEDSTEVKAFSVEETLAAVDRIDAALPLVRDLDAGDEELDVLANTAMDTYKDLIDLGMQVDSRSAAEIFSVASSLLGHAISAKTAKMTKKLKMVELQLKKAKLDADTGEKPAGEGVGHVMDRNELLAMLRNQQPE